MNECAHVTRRIIHKTRPFDAENPTTIPGEGKYLGSIMRGIHAVRRKTLIHVYSQRHMVPCESMSGLRVLNNESDVPEATLKYLIKRSRKSSIVFARSMQGLAKN